MAIYPDKKQGMLTGRFRVELQNGGTRYRKRHDSLKEAEEDERRVMALWTQGITDTTPKAPDGYTIAQGIERATGILWRNLPSEECNWAHVRFLAMTVGGNKLLDDVGTEDIRLVVRAIDALGRADGTVNRYLSHIKVFLQWCRREGYRTVGVDGIVWDWREEHRGRIRWITYDEEEVLLSLVPDNVAKLITVAIRTGCRRDELLTLQPDNIEDGLLHLWKTKNNEPRTVPMDEETTELIRELVATQTMPTRAELRYLWAVAKENMNLADDKEFVFHACRHTCATRLVDAGVDVLIIKQWLGHKRIETTQRYAHVTASTMQSALKKVGDRRAFFTKKPQKSALPTVPHHAPHGGGNGLLENSA